MPRLYRKVIKIPAVASPNIRLALAEIAAGKQPSGTILVPGVITYDEYVKRRATWDKIRQTIGLDAEFYEGAETLLYPPDWLNDSHLAYERLRGQRRVAKAIGCDPGEGVANTAYCAVDEKGIIELASHLTPDTSVIVGQLIAFIDKHQVPPDRVCIDRGGGGKQIADMVRAKGYPIRSVAFGESVTPPLKHGVYQVRARKEHVEERYTYTNRRVQMYGELRELLDPSLQNPVFAIPAEYSLLRKQMAPIPLQYDGEGRMLLPSKHRKPGQKETVIKTLTELCEGSPDELDALVLAVHGMSHGDPRPVVGPMWATKV